MPYLLNRTKLFISVVEPFIRALFQKESHEGDKIGEIEPVDTYFPDFNFLDSSEKQYLKAHLRRWLLTVELGGGFFDQLKKGTEILSLASDGKFELIAKKRYPNLDFTYSNWDLRHSYPLQDGVFDGVTCLEVLEHLKDPDSDELDYISTHYLLGFFNTLSEINRILKNDGLALFTTPNTSSHNSLISILRGESHFFYWPHVREFAPFELSYYFNKCGFEVLEMTSFSPYEDSARQTGFRIRLLEAVAGLFNASPMMNQLRGTTLFFLVRKIGKVDDLLMDSGFRLVTSDLIKEKCK